MSRTDKPGSKSEQTLSVNGYQMAFVEAGAGTPLLLLHGSLNDYRGWEPQMASFASHFRTVAVSFRHYWPDKWDGSGDTFTAPQHVDDVIGFIAALQAGPVDLVGHSRGAYIAFRVAEKRPELIQRLVLAEPSGVLDASLRASSEPPAEYADFISTAVKRVKEGDVEDGLRAFFEYTGGPGAWARRSPQRKQIARDNVYTLLGQITEQRQPYSAASAARIANPTLLVGGARTQNVFKKVLDGLERGIPGAQRVTISEAGHALTWDNAREFNAAVIDFLRSRS